MNNNRNNNRRRGRGNRNQGGSGGGNSGNRIDSRARGNAPQLLDKYKKLAQDAQHNGDRVQMEYYLQFADHYFRVIADNKARQDEARVKRDPERGSGQDDDDSDDDGEDNRQPRRNTRSRRNENDDRGDDQQDNRRKPARRPRNESRDDDRDGNVDRNAGDSSDETGDHDERPKRKVRKPRAAAPNGKSEGARGAEGEIDASVLPPSIAGDDQSSPEVAEKKPRRRRKPDGDDGTLTAVG
ncbi:DUF4167 domain-containing protein [Qipengyuania sp. CAU 1752]